jgi:hypothetical protein
MIVSPDAAEAAQVIAAIFRQVRVQNSLSVSVNREALQNPGYQRLMSSGVLLRKKVPVRTGLLPDLDQSAEQYDGTEYTEESSVGISKI